MPVEILQLSESMTNLLLAKILLQNRHFDYIQGTVITVSLFLCHLGDLPVLIQEHHIAWQQMPGIFLCLLETHG